MLSRRRARIGDLELSLGGIKVVAAFARMRERRPAFSRMRAPQKSWFKAALGQSCVRVAQCKAFPSRPGVNQAIQDVSLLYGLKPALHQKQAAILAHRRAFCTMPKSRCVGEFWPELNWLSQDHGIAKLMAFQLWPTGQSWLARVAFWPKLKEAGCFHFFQKLSMHPQEDGGIRPPFRCLTPL
jgi:hypothetical protein